MHFLFLYENRCGHKFFLDSLWQIVKKSNYEIEYNNENRQFKFNNNIMTIKSIFIESTIDIPLKTFDYIIFMYRENKIKQSISFLLYTKTNITKVYKTDIKDTFISKRNKDLLPLDLKFNNRLLNFNCLFLPSVTNIIKKANIFIERFNTFKQKVKEIKNTTVFSYEEFLINKENILKEICNKLNIEYYEPKEMVLKSDTIYPQEMKQAIENKIKICHSILKQKYTVKY